MSDHYDPNQPRVPAGHHEGGQWTPKGHPGQPISEGDAYKARGGNSSKQAAAGAAKPPAWMLAFLAPPPLVPDPKTASERAWDLFERLSARNTRNRRAVLVFRAAKYLRSAVNNISFEDVTLLDREEVGKYCKRLEGVQEYTNEAAARHRDNFKKAEAHQFGTAVHKDVADKVRAEKNRNFRAEQSMFQVGATGTVRYDILEYRPSQRTVCIYDIKTGNAVLGWRRMEIFARAALEYLRGARRVIVIQIRPESG